MKSKELNQKKKRLLKKLSVIAGLQGNRPVIVRVFDELVRVAPKEVYFKTLELKKKSFKLVGVAESNNQVSSLMRRLDESVWFSNPKLTAVKKINKRAGSINEFDLMFQQIIPNEGGSGQ